MLKKLEHYVAPVFIFLHYWTEQIQSPLSPGPLARQISTGVRLQVGHQKPEQIGTVPQAVQMNPIKPHWQRYLSARQHSVHPVIAAPGAGRKTQWLIQKGTKISSRGDLVKLLIQCQTLSLKEAEESFKTERARDYQVHHMIHS